MEKQDVEKRPLHELSEGPYYKEGSPERTNIVESGTSGEKLVVEGHLFNRKGNPVASAWLDFWQADGKGDYDNSGYNLRGHQYTDYTGSYHLETVVPAMYGPRTSHIHVKLQANRQSPIITTQLFFPDEPRNQTDTLFNPTMVVKINDSAEGKKAQLILFLILIKTTLPGLKEVESSVANTRNRQLPICCLFKRDQRRRARTY